MAAKTPRKLQSQRRLEALGIRHELVAFDATIRSAEEVARAAGEDPARVFKTLVVVDGQPRSRPLLAVVPAVRDLDLKKLAREAGVRKLSMAGHNEAERLTGLKVGGISALSLLEKGWSVYLDQSANEWDTILVSAGERGFDLRLAPDDFITVTGAVRADIVV